MKADKVRELTVEDLNAREKELQESLFRLRLQKSIGQLDKGSKIRDIRRDIARVKTVLKQKSVQAAEATR